MIQSAVLQDYSPIIVPLSFIYGLRGVLQSMPLGNIELIGVFFMLVSLFIFYDRIADQNKELFACGLILFLVSYLSIRTLNPLWLICMMAISLFLITKGILSDINFTTYSQYVYLSVILLFVGFILALIENNRLPPYPMALLINTFGISILTLTTLVLPKA